LVNGVRFVEIPLCGSVQLEKNKVYLLEIYNVKNQSKFLRINNLFDTNNCQ
jgi:hypothetical protein